MIKIIGPRDKKDPKAINACSSSNNWKGLSPFLIGPSELYDGMTSKNMENAWQYSKVYAAHADSSGEPTEAYWQWAKMGWDKAWADRYPMGRGAIPLYSLWGGQKLGYIEARKTIYMPLYAKAVANTEAFRALKELYLKEGTVTLWDFDGYDYLSLGMTLEEVLNEPTRKMGHAFVLAMLLEGKLFPAG